MDLIQYSRQAQRFQSTPVKMSFKKIETNKAEDNHRWKREIETELRDMREVV